MENFIDFEDILVAKYGEKGPATRDKFDAESLAYRLGDMLKEARQKANIKLLEELWK